METEKTIEALLRREVERRGGLCLKYTNANKSGYPDRLCMLPGGVSFWVELKSPGGKPRALQRERMRRLTELGQSVFTAASSDEVRLILHIVSSMTEEGL